jgi:hypothetical protein
VPPFVAKQPVQGFSAIIAGQDNGLWAIPDNGFGAKDNSADYLLRLYRMSPHFKTEHGGPGTIGLDAFVTLRDPDKKINFSIVADGAFYPNSGIAVDPAIVAHRWLTGADFAMDMGPTTSKCRAILGRTPI